MNVFSLFRSDSETVPVSNEEVQALPCPFCGEAPDIANSPSWVGCPNGCRDRNPFWHSYTPLTDWNEWVRSYDGVAESETLRCPKCGSLPVLHLDGETFRLECRCESCACVGPFRRALDGKRSWNGRCREIRLRMDDEGRLRGDIERLIDLDDTDTDGAVNGADSGGASEPVSAGVTTVTVVPDLGRLKRFLRDMGELVDRYIADRDGDNARFVAHFG